LLIKKNNMNILLIGSGGREHTLAWKLSQSPQLKKLYIAPGNAGTKMLGINIEIDINNFEHIKEFCLAQDINMIVVGPEEPLVNGISDFFTEDEQTKHIKMVGPKKNAAILEGSKDFAKQFMKKYNIPTASYRSFTKESFNEAIQFLKNINPPYVLKADGLAAGKGVIISSSFEQAQKELRLMLLESKFGKASQCVVVEEFLKGIELSVFVATDGESYKLMPSAKDYKKIGENDKGLNTGGMGAVAPAPFVDKALLDRIENLIIKPTIAGLKNENMDYQGFIFFGLMIFDGLPYVIEYNVRLGDPETEVVIPLLKTDIIDLFNAICDRKLKNINLIWDCHYAATVMLVSGGYPENYEKGKKIIFREDVNSNYSLVIHAGTKTDEEGLLFTNGGRVIAVTSFDKMLKHALNKCYNTIKYIHFDGMYFRKDIGTDMLKFIRD